jgi:hypothetical protein
LVKYNNFTIDYYWWGWAGSFYSYWYKANISSINPPNPTNIWKLLPSKIKMAYSNFTLSKVKSDFGLITDEAQDLFAEIA